jgi:signal transduction histidine kinase
VDLQGGPLVYSDQYRLTVIFNNLISNAIKYRDTAKDKPMVNIQGMISDESLVLYFKDNGIGISAEIGDRIFDMFFRATHQDEGSGLGLYIVKEAVEKLGGQISVESALGSGTTFKIIIPNMIGKPAKN